MQFPYAEVQFTTSGSAADPNQVRAAVNLVASSSATDVLVLAHGWNNDMPAARRLYNSLTDQIAAVRGDVPQVAGRGIAVIGALWPSVRWADEDGIAGGGAAVGTPATALHASIGASVDDPGAADRLKALASDLDSSPAARAEFLRELRSLMPSDVADDDPPPLSFLEGDTEDVFALAGGPEADLFDTADSDGGAAAIDLARMGAPGDAALAAGGGVGLLDLGRDALRAARNLLNVTTYYTMKDRAGKVGAIGVAGLLDDLKTSTSGASAARRHLAGHSFGARVVAAAAAHHRPIHSVTLLQGAFSHHGFAADYDDHGHNGFFRAALDTGRFTGPLVVTHTVNDKAVGLAYAIASRLARQAASGLGGPDDLYGGIGRNGALKTPESFAPPTDLLDVGGSYPFAAGKVHNLKGDRFISSHGDVTSPQVAYALLRAMVAG
jgi:hypothetical protein